MIAALTRSKASKIALAARRRLAGSGVLNLCAIRAYRAPLEPLLQNIEREVFKSGETIVNLESRLFFVHKGIEKLFESMIAPSRGVELAERISGDSSVAHALAFCMAVEQCVGIEALERAPRLPTGLP